MSNVISEEVLREVAESGTPVFVYSKDLLKKSARQLFELELPFGFTSRYAVKANNFPEIVKLFDKLGLHFDASSSYEAVEVIKLGVSPEKISLSSQQHAHNLEELLEAGVHYVATSLHQLEQFLGTNNHPKTVGLRVNPGIGAGHTNRTTTGGLNSSFGLWKDYVPEALALVRRNKVKIDRLHMHIGSGADPYVWENALETALEIVREMPDVVTLDVGGGFKIHRFGDEHETDMPAVFQVFSSLLTRFAGETGRELKLEIEPGTWLVGHAGTLVAEIVDIVDTGDDGHVFLRLNTGMNDILRPGMYGAQHEMQVLSDSKETEEYIVVGHNCETGDILTPAPSDPEGIESRGLRKAQIGDKIAIYDAGAYCRSMAAHGYNSYPNAREVMV